MRERNAVALQADYSQSSEKTGIYLEKYQQSRAKKTNKRRDPSGGGAVGFMLIYLTGIII